jgi:hypothetical protein
MSVYNKPKPKKPELTGLEAKLFKYVFNSKRWKWIKVLIK